MSDKVTFLISGKAMFTFTGSGLYQQPEHLQHQWEKDAHEALHNAIQHRVGRGYTYVTTATLGGAEEIRWYCATVGSNFVSMDDPEDRADGRALLKVAVRIHDELVKRGWVVEGEQMRPGA
jgi:hypothetical protein